jgi:hypothetical protein
MKGKNKKGDLILINCKECGIEVFKKVGTRRMFCSVKCAQKKFVKNPKENWGKKRNCLYCKKEYYPVIPKQRFCSSECCKIFYSFDFQCKNNGLGVSGWLKLRFEVFKRDDFTCQYCGRNVKDDKIKLQCDHIIPKSFGGENILSNLTTSCLECNEGKKDVLLEEKIKI